MTQRFLIGGLALTIIAMVGFGLFDAARQSSEDAPVAVSIMDTLAPTNSPVIITSTSIPPRADSTPVEEITPVPQMVVQAQDTIGDPWQAEGLVTELEDFGFTLTTAEGDYYVELGPPSYWQSQDVMLAEGDAISVNGYFNGEQIHARIVNVNGKELVLRTETGQPMWAGGAEAGGGNTQQAASGNAQFQVAPEDWVTLVGNIGIVTNGNVTLNMNDGTVINLQMGRPDFWQSQGITLNPGDPVEVLGFWSGEQFMAGDIRKTETGETIMLRDPNGRQLWSGPGRNGAQSTESQGQGQGGNGYRGGRE